MCMKQLAQRWAHGEDQGDLQPSFADAHTAVILVDAHVLRHPFLFSNLKALCSV